MHMKGAPRKQMEHFSSKRLGHDVACILPNMERIFCPYLTNMHFTGKCSVRFVSDFLIPTWVCMSHLLCSTASGLQSVVLISTVLNNLESHLTAAHLLPMNLGNICYIAVL